MATWEEIRRLASDLERVQLGAAAKKLSERNMVEVVTKLKELGLVELVHTVDGAEYLTRQHLATEIRNEVAAANGRAPLDQVVVVTKLKELGLVELVHTVDGAEYLTRQHLATEIRNEVAAANGRAPLDQIADALNVDYTIVSEAAASLADADLRLVMGQLISQDYLANVVREVAEKLEDEGKVYLSDLTKHYDLPTELVREVVNDALENRVQGAVDRENAGLFYTLSYLETQKAVVRGCVSGLSRVAAASKLAKATGLSGDLFFRLLDELVQEGHLAGTLTGGRSLDRALWVPHVYQLMLHSYTSGHFANNGYVDLTALKKLGVGEVSEHLASALGKAPAAALVKLNSLALGKDLFQETKDKVAEEVSSVGWCEVGAMLPQLSTTTDADAQDLAQLLLKGHQDWRLTSDGYLYAHSLLGKAEAAAAPLVAEKAKRDGPDVLKELQAAKTAAQSGRKDEDDDWDSGKGKKGKKGKAKGGGAKKDKGTQQTTGPVIEFLSAEELEELVGEKGLAGADAPASVVAELVEELAPKLNAAYRAQVESVFLASEASALGAQKRSHGEFKEQMAALHRNLCLFDAGAGHFDDATAGQLRGFLLRSLGTEAANLALAYISGGDPASLTPGKGTDTVIAGLDSAAGREAFKALYASLAGKKDSLDEFFDALEEVCGGELCGLALRVPDKRLRTELVRAHCEAVAKELTTSKDPAQGLLLALIFLFSRAHADCALHASGKFVPAVASLLGPSLDAELADAVRSTQSLVVQSLKAKGDAEVAGRLESAFAQLKDRVLRPAPKEQ